ncbi:MAG: hypothetical protein ABEJ86_06475 [Halococcoides sp.]
METSATVEWFEDGDERRSVLFAIAMAAGFLSIVAGVSTIMATSRVIIGIALFAIGLAVFALATSIASGQLDSYLFGDSSATETTAPDEPAPADPSDEPAST